MTYYVEVEDVGVFSFPTLTGAKKTAYQMAKKYREGEISIRKGNVYIAQINGQIRNSKLARIIYFSYPEYNPYQLYADGRTKRLQWANKEGGRKDDRIFKDY